MIANADWAATWIVTPKFRLVDSLTYDRFQLPGLWLLSSKRLIPAETRAYVPAVMAASQLLTGGSVLGSSAEQMYRTPTILYASSAAGGQQ